MKALSITLATAAAAALVLVGAAPALAAGSSIDPDDKMYAVTCLASDYNDWQALSVDPTTAFSTKIGDGTGAYTDTACAGQPAYNAATGKSYYIQYDYQIGGGYLSSLASLDVTTGASTTIGEFNYINIEFPVYPVVDALAIGKDGSAYVLAEGDLYSVDLASGYLTYIASDANFVNTYAFAVDPTSGLFYAIQEDGQLYKVNVADGTVELLSLVGEVNTEIWSLQIDGGGRFWIQANEETPSGSGLWSFALSDPSTPVYSGPFIDGPYYTEAILIVPGAALAATGVDSTAVPLIAGGAVVLALLGVGGLVVARRRRAA